jgi:hypothetical protein
VCISCRCWGEGAIHGPQYARHAAGEHAPGTGSVHARAAMLCRAPHHRSGSVDRRILVWGSWLAQPSFVRFMPTFGGHSGLMDAA